MAKWLQTETETGANNKLDREHKEMNLEQIIPNKITAGASRQVWLRRAGTRAFLLTRAAWPIYVALLMSLFIAAGQVRSIHLTNPPAPVLANLEQRGFTTGFYAFFFLGFEIAFALGFIVIASIVFARHSDDKM